VVQVIKLCPRELGRRRSDSAKCEHSWVVRYWEDGRQRERSFHRNHKLAVAFSKKIEAE
jgi:hypothetical protein